MLDRWYLLGILLFYGVQVAYMVRICKANGGHALLIPRFLLFSLLLVALYQLELFTPETAAAALYFSHLPLQRPAEPVSAGRRGPPLLPGTAPLPHVRHAGRSLSVPQPLPSPPLFRGPGRDVALLPPGQVLIVLSGLVIPSGGVPDETE